MRTEQTKADEDLGGQVHSHLVSLGIETPSESLEYRKSLRKEDGASSIKTSIEEHFRAIMSYLGLDLEDDSLTETPKRVAKMYWDELFWGLDYANFPKSTTVENKMQYDEMLLEKSISVKSMCEHHFLPIVGKASVAYLPKQKVIGLSKINRIVEFFSRRPQIQERLTAQIHGALCFLLETDDVAVVIEAEHMCVSMRGVEDDESQTVTSKVSGIFKNSSVSKSEFMSLMNR